MNQPENAEKLTQQAENCYAQGDLVQAKELCEKAIQLQPKWPITYVTLANIVYAQGNITEAINLYLQALAIEPNLPQAQVNLGSMYYLQENWQGAIACYEKALALQPDFQAAKFNLVKVLERIGKTTEARQLLEETPAVNNLSAPAEKYWQQAKSLTQSGQLDEAIAHYQEVIKLQPDLPEAHCQIGIHLKQQGKWQEALSYLEKAITLRPNYGMAYQHLCGIYRDNNNYLLAREYVNRYTQNCQETEPIISQVYLISTYQVAGLNEIAKDRFLGLDQSLKADVNTVKTVAEARSLYANFLFSMPYLRDNIQANSETAQLISDLYIERVISQQGVHNKLANFSSYASNPRLKLGILSNHFNRHSVGWCSIDVIEELSCLPIDIYLYTTASLKIDDLTNRFAKIAKILHQPQHYPNGMANAGAIASQMRADGINVLLDLDSFSIPIHSNILAYQPAPVCISWLGFDAPYISSDNYFLGDRYTLPADRQQYYREKLVRMPNGFMAVRGFQSYHRDRVNMRRAQRISQDQIVYLSMASGRKFNQDLVKAQVAILKQVPDSLLIHKSPGDQEVFKAAYKDACEKAGVGFHRIKLLPLFNTEEEHRDIYVLGDVLLDSYPYNAGTHGLEALWFNVPLVTYTGEQFLSRMGYAFLQTIGINEGIAHSWDEYINWGVKYGQDNNLRQSVINQLIQAKNLDNLSPLWHPQKFAEDLYGILQDLLKQAMNRK